MKRFYPNALPPYPLEPKPSDFLIKEFDDGVGQGVVSLKSFCKGEVLFVFTGFLVTEITQYTLQIKKGLHLHDPFFMGKVLHSCDPNTHCDMKNRLFKAIKPIKKGDLITMDYMQTETELFKGFECHCGASNCKGNIGVSEDETSDVKKRKRS